MKEKPKVINLTLKMTILEEDVAPMIADLENLINTTDIAGVNFSLKRTNLRPIKKWMEETLLPEGL